MKIDLAPPHILLISFQNNMKQLLIAIAAVVPVWTAFADPIHDAASNRDLAGVQAELDKGVDVDAKDEEGWTPLHLAAYSDGKDIVGLLIAAGADVDARDEEGWPPLHLAAYSGGKDIVELLIAVGADVNAKNKHGETPLDYANGVVATLLRHGAKTVYELKALMPRLVQHGQFAFSFVAKKGKVYEVQDSFDLLNWEVIKTYTGTGDSIRFDEKRDHDPPQWFYRVRVVE